MKLDTLYNIAECDNIDVYSFDLENSECLSYMDNNLKCYIAIDPFKIKSKRDELVKLAHELGHCETGSFYNRYALCDIRAKHERRADKWAIKKLIPKNEFDEAKKYCNNRYELSEHFGVPEDFMQMAIDFYL